jgi:glycosyltransferase involved in cell wall biosynthesis
MKNKILIISNTDGALYKFRKHLIERLNNIGCFTIGITSPTSPEGSYSDKLSKICGRLYLENFARQGLSSLFTPLNIFNICKNERPNVVHIYGHEALIFTFISLLRFFKIRFVLTITGLGRFFSPRATLFEKCIRFAIIFIYFIALLRIARVIFLNSQDFNWFSKIFPHYKGKFILINGEGSDFSVSNKACIQMQKNPINFLFASRLMRDKGIIELIQAFQSLSSNYHLSVLGTIDDAIRNDSSIVDMLNGSICNVKYFGFLSDITEFLEGADCVILPTRYMEGLPIILVESLAKGKFIITTQAPGCMDTVVENVNGFLLKDVTSESISAAVTNISSANFEIAHETSTKLFSSKFIASIVVDKIIETYNIDDFKK